jgi:hypothetical protein
VIGSEGVVTVYFLENRANNAVLAFVVTAMQLFSSEDLL